MIHLKLKYTTQFVEDVLTLLKPKPWDSKLTVNYLEAFIYNNIRLIVCKIGEFNADKIQNNLITLSNKINEVFPGVGNQLAFDIQGIALGIFPGERGDLFKFPSELIQTILSNLPPKALCSTVSKAWDREVLLMRVSHLNHGTMTLPTPISYEKNKFFTDNQLQRGKFRHLTEGDWKKLMGSNPHMTRIEYIISDSFPSLKGFKQLKSLKLDCNGRTIGKKAFQGLSLLEVLEIEHSGPLPRRVFKGLSLVHTFACRHFGLSTTLFKALQDLNPDRLEKLYLFDLTDDGDERNVEILKKFNKLRVVSLKRFYCFTSALIGKSFGGLGSLEILDYFGTRQFFFFDEIKILIKPSLKCLNLGLTINIKVIKFILENTPFLKELDLESSHLDNFFDDKIYETLPLLPKLRKAFFNPNNYAAALCLLDKFPNIEELSLALGIDDVCRIANHNKLKILKVSSFQRYNQKELISQLLQTIPLQILSFGKFNYNRDDWLKYNKKGHLDFEDLVNNFQ